MRSDLKNAGNNYKKNNRKHMVYFDLSDFDKGWKRETGFRGTRDLQRKCSKDNSHFIHALLDFIYIYLYYGF